ncbi:hypothetical protein [Kitasatospora kifunensis]|uniref:Uncharacterized protein n=1 Tax=Kitasatospora kifunensis TaxID=58351 RepID=A0A7W7RB90_KITKI|nr:hypothetical protein [Kitasatospora kifunensis]MBB4928817.1 hypothetical protein [Kitasatospora kifunensis]
MSSPTSRRAASVVLISALFSLAGLGIGLLAHLTYQAHRPDYERDVHCAPVALPHGLTTYAWLAVGFVLAGLLALLWIAARRPWRTVRPRRGAVPAAVALWIVAVVGGVAPGWADISYMHRMNAGMYMGSDLCGG